MRQRGTYKIMVLLGTLVNAFSILVGGILGLALPKLSQGVRTTVMQGLGLAVAVQGIMMALKTNNLLIVIGSLVVGGLAGELFKVEAGLEKLGQTLERSVGAKAKGKVAAGFVTTTLIYCVGAMAILGSIDSGIRHNHDMLYTKSMLDGFSAIIFASTLGVGVLFSSLPVLLYQGAIALSATLITSFISTQMLDAITAEITSVGGILIIGIGLNILEIKKINVANLLPSVVVAALLVPIVAYFS
ncbi:MAG: rane protein [Paenibacillaceae bacterium]|nr:rane protein [Paenibacillaceae bacterium]